MKKPMSPELVHYLRRVNDNTLIGLCIRQILNRQEELQDLLRELQTLSKENPEIMIPIIGEEAHRLLMR
jgi:hypothetical protein